MTLSEKIKNRKSDDFWEIVAILNWSADDEDDDWGIDDESSPENMGRCLAENCSEELIKKWTEEYLQYRDNIHDQAKKTQKELGIQNFFETSDDGWSDASHHIIGMGEKFYTMFMKETPRFKKFIDDNFGGPTWFYESPCPFFDAEDYLDEQSMG